MVRVTEYPDSGYGNPWANPLQPADRAGSIAGVIGGYQEGGDTAAISYSSYLGKAVLRLYHEAITDAAPSAG